MEINPEIYRFEADDQGDYDENDSYTGYDGYDGSDNFYYSYYDDVSLCRSRQSNPGNRQLPDSLEQYSQVINETELAYEYPSKDELDNGSDFFITLFSDGKAVDIATKDNSRIILYNQDQSKSHIRILGYSRDGQEETRSYHINHEDLVDIGEAGDIGIIIADRLPKNED